MRDYLEAYLGGAITDEEFELYCEANPDNPHRYRPMYIWNTYKPDNRSRGIVVRAGVDITSIVPVDNSKTKMMPFEGCK